ncbi:hypothetical protein [Nocardia sp. MDA0666]|uniref:hypothetical protein n=1 Tax=Nocardia sp. MDA0666 TaxID=2135448 RepID=UPI0011B28A77|nr:hypothetical protein [Nocardia sp. MDA0666]
MNIDDAPVGLGGPTPPDRDPALPAPMRPSENHLRTTVLIRPDGIVQQTGRRVADLRNVLLHFDIRTPPPSVNDGAQTDDRSFDAQAC